MSCGKSQGFLADNDIQITDTVIANKEKFGRADALSLAQDADRVIVAKGKKVVTFDMKDGRPDDETLLGAMLGPTGNLRAPTIRSGKTLLVGFNDDLFSATLG